MLIGETADLVAAVDKSGLSWVFARHGSRAGAICRLVGETSWYPTESGIAILNGVKADPACKGLALGEAKCIDLSASTIVHVAPKKTAVEELVEKANDLLLSVNLIDGPDSKDFRIVSVESVSNLHFALARVRQEGGV